MQYTILYNTISYIHTCNRLACAHAGSKARSLSNVRRRVQQERLASVRAVFARMQRCLARSCRRSVRQFPQIENANPKCTAQSRPSGQGAPTLPRPLARALAEPCSDNGRRRPLQMSATRNLTRFRMYDLLKTAAARALRPSAVLPSRQTGRRCKPSAACRSARAEVHSDEPRRGTKNKVFDSSNKTA